MQPGALAEPLTAAVPQGLPGSVGLHGILGDAAWNRLPAAVPARRAAAPEIALHAAREFLYTFLFLALAWFEWRGGWAVLIAAVLATEVVLTLCDFIVEDRTRKLPPFERILHTVLAVVFGAVIAVLAPVLQSWWAMQSAVVPVFHGPFSWLFTLFAAGVFAWSVRNALAALRHARPQEWVREPLTAGRTERPRTVLVTGATGFIGGHIVRRLVSRGDRVIVLTRDPERGSYGCVSDSFSDVTAAHCRRSRGRYGPVSAP